MIPTFRPDAAHRLLGDPPAWNAWADRLGTASGVPVEDLDSLLAALDRVHTSASPRSARRASDHGLAWLPDVRRATRRLADAAVRSSARRAATPSRRERDAVAARGRRARRPARRRRATACCSCTSARAATSRRGSSTAVGRDAGADAVDDERQGPGWYALPRPRSSGTARCPAPSSTTPTRPTTTLFATIAGAFSRAGVAPLVQWGPPWWFNDHEDGMRRQLDDPLADRAARRLHRDGHRLALDALDDPARALPAHPLRQRSAATSTPA